MTDNIFKFPTNKYSELVESNVMLLRMLSLGKHLIIDAVDSGAYNDKQLDNIKEYLNLVDLILDKKKDL